MKKCPLMNDFCIGEDCMLYVKQINECVFVALNRSLFKLEQAIKESKGSKDKFAGFKPRKINE